MLAKTCSLILVLACACNPDESEPATPDGAVASDPDAPTQCQAESLSALCGAASYQCGEASFTDRCGNRVAGSCGTCSSGTCGDDHACTVPGWQQITWPSTAQSRIVAMWNTPGSSTVWAGGGLFGSGELWKIDGFQLGSTSGLPGVVTGIHGVGTDLWAVGSAGLIVRGTTAGTFSLAPSAGLESYNLYSVWAFSANDVWVTTNGINSIGHWNGTSWSFYSLPSTPVYPNCAGLWGAAPNDLWAACTKGELFHWNGTAWTKASSPTTQTLQEIYGFAANDIWAVGDANTLLHYDGTSWHQTSLPSSGGGLFGVWGTAPNNVYVVGSKVGGGRVLHFNGSSWAEVFTTNAGSLERVSGAQGRVWVVGYPALLYAYPL